MSTTWISKRLKAPPAPQPSALSFTDRNAPIGTTKLSKRTVRFVAEFWSTIGHIKIAE